MQQTYFRVPHLPETVLRCFARSDCASLHLTCTHIHTKRAVKETNAQTMLSHCHCAKKMLKTKHTVSFCASQTCNKVRVCERRGCESEKSDRSLACFSLRDRKHREPVSSIPPSKRQTMRTYANFKKYERMLLIVIAKTSRCYHRKEHSL